MPHSRHRHKHESHQPHHHPAPPKPARKATPIITFLAAIFGLVVGAMASESNWLWMAIGAIAGTLAGYFIGKNIDNTADKK
jgi:Glycine zipper